LNPKKIKRGGKKTKMNGLLVMGVLVFIIALFLSLRYVPGFPWHPDTLCKSTENGECPPTNRICAPAVLGHQLEVGSGGVKLEPGFVLENGTGRLRFQSGGLTTYQNGQVVSSTGTTTAVRGDFDLKETGALRLFDENGREIWGLKPPFPGNMLSVLPSGQVQISNLLGPVWTGNLSDVQPS
jgi:hypothetical protein